MTADIQRQIAAAKGRKPPATPRAQPTQGKTPPTPKREPAEEITPPIPPPSQYYIGPYHIQVAPGTHFPGRVRLVLTGPTVEGLAEAVAAAIHQFHFKP